MKQQGQEISKSTLVQQLNISKGNTPLSIGPSNAGLSTLDPKQQEIKQVVQIFFNVYILSIIAVHKHLFEF